MIKDIRAALSPVTEIVKEMNEIAEMSEQLEGADDPSMKEWTEQARRLGRSAQELNAKMEEFLTAIGVARGDVNRIAALYKAMQAQRK